MYISNGKTSEHIHVLKPTSQVLIYLRVWIKLIVENSFMTNTNSWK